MKPMRAKGRVLTLPDKEPKGFLADEAKTIQKQRQEQKIVTRAYPPAPPPNWKCYPMVFVVGKNIDERGNWKGGRLPKCRVCEGTLHPQENHVCDGFKPKFVEWTPEEWAEREEARRERAHERWEQQREMIREAKRNGTFFPEEDYDEPEEDWFDEDESYEEDDGDPMWD